VSGNLGGEESYPRFGMLFQLERLLRVRRDVLVGKSRGDLRERGKNENAFFENMV